MLLLSLENIRLQKINVNGVYIIYLCDNNGSKVPINRLCKTDYEGILYIGAAEKTKISYRLTNFLNSANAKKAQNNHSAGTKILNNNNLKLWISEYFLYFDIIKCSLAKSHEKELLKKYRFEFGELPPLNG
jgi:hypothetical protein